MLTSKEGVTDKLMQECNQFRFEYVAMLLNVADAWICDRFVRQQSSFNSLSVFSRPKLDLKSHGQSTIDHQAIVGYFTGSTTFHSDIDITILHYSNHANLRNVAIHRNRTKNAESRTTDSTLKDAYQFVIYLHGMLLGSIEGMQPRGVMRMNSLNTMLDANVYGVSYQLPKPIINVTETYIVDNGVGRLIGVDILQTYDQDDSVHVCMHIRPKTAEKHGRENRTNLHARNIHVIQNLDPTDLGGWFFSMLRVQKYLPHYLTEDSADQQRIYDLTYVMLSSCWYMLQNEAIPWHIVRNPQQLKALLRTRHHDLDEKETLKIVLDGVDHDDNLLPGDDDAESQGSVDKYKELRYDIITQITKAEDQSDDKLLNDIRYKVSWAAYLALDQYYTCSAFKDIVLRADNLNKYEYIQSAWENLGFLCRYLHQSQDSSSKACKYMSRIVTSLEHADVKISPSLKWSKILEKTRKTQVKGLDFQSMASACGEVREVFDVLMNKTMELLDLGTS